MNIIFAVTEEQFNVYELLQANVEGSSAGTLSADSSNIVQLVQAQYQAITSSIEMKDNSTGSVKVTYYSSCVDGRHRQTNKCSGLRVGSKVQFTAKIEVVKCPKDPREWKQTFQIKPVGIDEAVLVNLEMMCQCDCEKPGNEVSLVSDSRHVWDFRARNDCKGGIWNLMDQLGELICTLAVIDRVPQCFEDLLTPVSLVPINFLHFAQRYLNLKSVLLGSFAQVFASG